MSSPSPSVTDSSLLVVQLTDSHLFADAEARLLGMQTQDSLQRVVELVRREQPRIDLVLASGDISQDGSADSYARFLRICAPLAAPLRWLPGNHDDPEVLARAGGECRQPVVDLGDWRLVLLDSVLPGAVPGFLDADELARLERALVEAPGRHHLVCLHHHPVSVGCQWMESIGLRNAEALFAVLDRFPQVRALLWGHVHQEFDRMRRGVRLLASPSTCVQFTPGSADFSVSDQAPGYRWLRLHADGRLDTGVSRLTGYRFRIDYATDGY
ncbi:cyclic 3,5-nucleotide monophosphate metallophosphodiesterase [Azotobacter vinelandii CA]|uniref:Cyclic 3,5-nucleotide monophosphate metallophosphodiesterase n=2 Tax=Azotobacter vinelandii TaxID=354 RepID=C1DFS5_AZOVD|nr:3',5'-cyclic-AMP phosphodiesterase [Azotobacter vinelandii]ACO80471.1 cyclic 3,5-nucleotide monophosphate metallophosphodiesterase [Azotobacter vinelandii DJ]AGK15991.1 cyclic 3,5-nucleotide monophosphate metallophosphodiesterase [Azotobacter vinelandii CA]AGK21931.1 cyclic 3,5-nucleotide monophosphate metallophosphodiesterase [Azotobacter vinelandii CA6]SFX35101.1 Icc protein [Azotobacter vinelandii]GLK58518.1 3',5'-cyclic adenosine monophosphate phosphodiesterase CpdA [Azotobacter vinelan